MKTVEYYRNLGLVFVNGDFIIERDGSSNRGDSSFDVDRHFNQDSAFNASKVESFAWRNDDGVKPRYKGVVEVELNNGQKRKAYVSDITWIRGFGSSVAKWRPVVLQSESPKEDKPMKPVYTQEMHAKSELPPVGSEVKVCIKSAGFEADEQDVKFEGKTVTVKAAFSNAESEKIVAVENEDGNCACYIIECIKPIIKTIKVNGFDVPAPMSEAPEHGVEYFIASINSDYFVNDYRFHGDSYDKRWLSRGIAHSSKKSAIAHAKAMLGIDPNA